MKRCILLIFSCLFISFNACALRIVSLSPYLTESIILLDAESFLAGITSIDRDMFGLDQEVVGDTLNINIEKIAALKPDIILATPMNKIERVGKLKELGIKIEYFQAEESFRDCCDNFLRLAGLLDRISKAQDIIDSMNKELKEILLKKCGDRKPRIFLEVGTSPLITAGRLSYLNDLLIYAGGENIAQDIGSGFFRVAKEKILESNPDYIIVMSENYVFSKNFWLKYGFLNAVAGNNIIEVNADLFSRPNPVNFVQAVYLLRSVICPEILDED
ncbi:MAG: helical backbone metal receptor [Candidatus Omnitrophica bacterium]|nr:helical backbone metal receptor [Candidatus Omnitrophota bacterium]